MTDILAEHAKLTDLLDNNWLSLTVVDPQQEHRAFHYNGDLEWTPISKRTENRTEIPAVSATADD